MPVFSSQAPLDLVVSKESGSRVQSINHALAIAREGDTILVRSGLYQESITIDKPVTILGEAGAQDTIIEGIELNCIDMQASEAKIKNLTLQGDPATCRPNFRAVLEIHRGNLIIENCFITTSIGIGVKIYQGAFPLIKNCRIYGGKDTGIKIVRGGGGIIENCDISYHHSSNIIISGEGKSIVRKCKIHGSKKSGIWIAENSSALIEECQIYANAYPGIGITSKSNPTIRNCQIYNGTNGILITNNSRGTIENCKIFKNSYPGIAITAGANPTIRNCQIYNGTNGISIAERGKGIIEDCQIYNNTYPGIAINLEGNPKITRCKIYEGKSYGILVTEKGKGIIEETEIYKNIKPGIAITSEANPLIKKCTIYENKSNGIAINKQGKGIIEDCVIRDNESLPIAIEKGSNPWIERCETLDSKYVDYLWQQIDCLVGLADLKRVVKEIIDTEIANQRLRAAGMKVDEIESRHMAFIGNPGTGKTTVANIVAEILKQLGVLKQGKFIEVRRDILVGQYQGHTAKRTAKVVKSALDGILFIDEAYALMQSEQDEYGKEAINTLISLMEKHRHRLVVIFAGYGPSMQKLFAANPGLESRIAYQIQFPDYTPREMQRIFATMCDKSGWICNQYLLDSLLQVFENIYTSRDDNFANARNVRNLLEAMVRRLKSRIVKDNLAGQAMLNLNLDDIPPEYRIVRDRVDKENLSRLLGELNDLIGLDSVKDAIGELVHTQLANQKLLQAGHQVRDNETRHMLFTGNPGTGKTTVARLVGQIFKALGLLKKGNFYEVNRANLVAQYQGQTALRTKQAVELALDGVLFIDEAYALNKGNFDSYGSEAIDTLVPLIEKYRDRLIVIFAGYSREMKSFIAANSGLESRIAYKIEFPDYTGAQLHRIFISMAAKDGWIVTEDVDTLLQAKFAALYGDRPDNFANARDVRNLYEKMVRSIKTRIVLEDLSPEEMRKFTVKDIPTT
ncbi:MAG: right-handed parallel beta-helix repeat-containing protein [Prochloraceae cyanobacterium]|nr:right-handed parallel beta-helix repeat-containing protein [Prochloraceae cyanobacterium]